MKSNNQDKKSNYLPPEELNILKKSNAGVGFDAVGVRAAENKANISSQNEDTGLPSYSPDDTKPYERKNMSDGFYKRGTGSK